MNYIYAPWRRVYFSEKKTNCVFCDIIYDKNDEENMIIFRDSLCFGVMNRYPYSPGHFMIIPYFHTDAIEELDEKTWQQMSFHVKNGVKLLKDKLNTQGVNIGMNLGDAAGAGIAKHVHYHLVPRYFKDTNFITSIADTRVNGADFRAIYEEIKSVAKDYFKGAKIV